MRVRTANNDKQRYARETSVKIAGLRAKIWTQEAVVLTTRAWCSFIDLTNRSHGVGNIYLHLMMETDPARETSFRFLIQTMDTAVENIPITQLLLV
jgi:hypothetical protein